MGIRVLVIWLFSFAPTFAIHAWAQSGRLFQESNLHNQRGMELAQAGRTAEALKEFRASVAIAPDAAVYLNIGVAERELHNESASLAAFDCGLILDPNHISLYLQRAISLNRLGRAREAEADFVYGRKRDAAMAQRFADEFARSRVAAKAVVLHTRVFPGTVNDWFNEGVRRYSILDERGALDPLTAVIEKTRDPQALLYRARCYNDLRSYQLALDDATAAIQGLPRYGEAYRIRARVWSAYADYGRALSDLNEAIRLNPRLGLAYVDRSNLNYRFRPNLEASIQGDLDRAIEMDPENPFVWHNHAAVYMSRDQVEPAIRDLSRAIQLKPDMAASYANRAVLYYETGRRDLGDRDVRQALKLDPSLESSIDTQIRQIQDLPAIRAHIQQIWDELHQSLTGGQARRCSMYFGGAHSACMINDMTKARREEARQHGIELK